MSSKATLIAVASILCLISVTLYLAFAFPYSMFQLKQTENNELKMVVIVAQSGDYLPLLDPYSRGDFSSSSSYKPDLVGHQELTNTGKERMFLLGKFLKLRYYTNMLQGNPRKVLAQSVSTDQALESAQAFLAGLNPAQDSWCWSQAACSELAGWQPKAIHSFPAKYDELLAPQDNCPILTEYSISEWKRSTNYKQLLDIHASTLESLETNIDLDLRKNLELIPLVENWLNTRKVVAGSQSDNLVKWYTNDLSKQLTNLTESVMKSYLETGNEARRLKVARLLDEVMGNIDKRIEIESRRHLKPKSSDEGEKPLQQANYVVLVNATDESTSAPDDRSNDAPINSTKPTSDSTSIDQPLEDILEPPNVYLYMTDGQQLNALMNSLQIDSNQQAGPGDLLLIELHRSSVTDSFYLRLFSISSSAPDVFPEPIQVKTIACGDSTDCLPSQLKQTIKPLMLDHESWTNACSLGRPFQQFQEPSSTITSSAPPSSVPSSTTTTPTTDATKGTDGQTIDSSEPVSSPAPSGSSTLDTLDGSLIVGPIHPLPTTIFQHTNLSNSISSSDGSSTSLYIYTSDIARTTSAPKSPNPAKESDIVPVDQVSNNSSTQSPTNTTEVPSTTMTPLAQTLAPNSEVSVLVATLDNHNNQQELANDS